MSLKTYEQVTLVPRQISELRSRSEADTGVDAFGLTIKLPLVASPMPDVCNGRMAYTLARLGAFGIIHRFQSIQNQIDEYNGVAIKDLNQTDRDELMKYIGCAIGIADDSFDRFVALYNSGCRVFCIDTANGANFRVADTIKKIRDEYGNSVYLIAGNIATGKGYSFLADANADAVRVGIAGGSVCTTRTETGVYVPMASSVMECVEAREKLNHKPLIIADGGVRKPADLCKALALGADLAMAGGIFAGTKESPGMVIRPEFDPTRKVKLYRGAASFSVQYEYTDFRPEYNEGDESFVPYIGSVEDVLKRFSAGLRSSMSYMNARTIKEYQKNVTIEFI
jgi:IMP dehydrogenase